MDQVSMTDYNLEEANKAFYENFEKFTQRVSDNGGTAMVKSEGQWSLDLGIELPIDQMLPVPPQELAWRTEKNKL